MPLLDLTYPRFSSQGYNPEIEDLMSKHETKRQRIIKALEGSDDVELKEMAEFYTKNSHTVSKSMHSIATKSEKNEPRKKASHKRFIQPAD
jgi:hypothetical protein